ncbi:MAG: phage portal protein [Clostridia bacterium]|nr:phage portal protein [Clostridia bacterium]
MFYLNREIPLDAALLHKMIARFNVGVKPRLEKYKNYYEGAQAILRKSYADASKPCNKSVINYTKTIVDTYTGYIATPSYIKYSSNEDISEIMDILRYNDYQTVDAELLQEALIYGIGAELMFIDAEGQTRFRLINPLTCFGVYDDSLTEDLLYFVRIYKLNEWEDSDIYKVDVYSDFDIKHYTMSGYNGALSFIGEEPHYFSQCPANLLVLPEERSIFDCILTLQDSVNELVSAEIDDYSAFCDAYLALIGVDADADDIAAMKQNRAMILPEGASAQWITKNANDAQVENILKRLHDSIYRVSCCVDFSSESLMSGIASGISIRYKMSGMEQRAGKIEAVMRKALQRRVEIICGIASLKLGEAIFRDINIDFKRNIPEDETAVINLVNTLKGTVSDATLLAQLPFIDDVEAELEALQAEKAANMSLYGFGAFGSTEEETEVE